MADKTIGLFPAVVTPAGTDKILVEQGGVTKYETATQLLAAEVAARQSADTTLTNNLAAKAAVNSQVFTGTPSLPTGTTGVTQAANDSTTKLATTAFATTADLLRLRLSGADTMLGALNMGSNKINNLTDGTSNQDAVSLLQMNTGLDLKASILEAYDPTATGAYPTTWNGLAIKKGARYYISVAGTIGPATALAVQVGDELEALVNAAGNVHASWIIIQGNAVQATTTTAGIGETATDAEAIAKSSTTTFLTPSNLATGNFQASTTFEGLIELATQAEVDAKTDTTRAVTPATLGAFASSSWDQFVGIEHVVNYSAGTWTTTRLAQGDYVKRKTAAADTTIIGIDITAQIILGGSSGFKLSSFDVIHRNTTDVLNAHTFTVTGVTYTDSAAITSASLAYSGTLPTTTNANPRVTNIAASIPFYINHNRVVVEITVNATATAVYDFIGLNLHFTKTL